MQDQDTAMHKNTPRIMQLGECNQDKDNAECRMRMQNAAKQQPPPPLELLCTAHCAVRVAVAGWLEPLCLSLHASFTPPPPLHYINSTNRKSKPSPVASRAHQTKRHAGIAVSISSFAACGAMAVRVNRESSKGEEYEFADGVWRGIFQLRTTTS